MTHSVSHNLILELNGSDLTVVVLTKENLVKEVNFYHLIDSELLKEILQKLPEIYTTVTLLIRRNNFVLIPDIYFQIDNSNYYKLSYKLAPEERLQNDKTDHNINIVYALNSNFTDIVLSKFPRISIKHEVSVIIHKIYKEIGLKQPRILLVINEDSLIIFAIKDGKLELGNLYAVKTIDDIFYFVLLAIEQLHFVPNETELVILGEPPNRAELFELFKNYIQEINIWLEAVQIGEGVLLKGKLNSSFALQNLICE